MSRDDWKYHDDEELWEEEKDEGEGKKKEVQCPRCTRFVEADATFCSWCGKPLER